jgi:16S rRNA (cytosine967-C5)-methyltransferase
VTLVRRAGKQSASGFANAVLRAVSRRRTSLPLPPRPADTTDRAAVLDYLSITLSHPRWLAARWLERVGLDRAEAWMRFDNQPAKLTLRANVLTTSRAELLRRLDSAGVEAHAARFAPEGIVIDQGNLRDEATSGRFVVQDEASQLVALLAGTAPGPLVLDTCASPGGKATAIASTLAAGDRLIACDVRDRRMALLRQTIQAVGADSIRLVQADLLQPLPFRARFSTVVVDAPCSGLGTLRRDPDIRWRREEDALAGFAAAQRRMLEHASALVDAGGRLVYATCSSEPEENEAVAAAFLAAHPEFAPLRADAAHPAIVPELVDARGHLRTEPDRHGLELFFGAVFERARHL